VAVAAQLNELVQYLAPADQAAVVQEQQTVSQMEQPVKAMQVDLESLEQTLAAVAAKAQSDQMEQDQLIQETLEQAVQELHHQLADHQLLMQAVAVVELITRTTVAAQQQVALAVAVMAVWAMQIPAAQARSHHKTEQQIAVVAVVALAI
jgi:hypothetical protein